MRFHIQLLSGLGHLVILQDAEAATGNCCGEWLGLLELHQQTLRFDRQLESNGIWVLVLREWWKMLQTADLLCPCWNGCLPLHFLCCFGENDKRQMLVNLIATFFIFHLQNYWSHFQGIHSLTAHTLGKKGELHKFRDPSGLEHKAVRLLGKKRPWDSIEHLPRKL